MCTISIATQNVAFNFKNSRLKAVSVTIQHKEANSACLFSSWSAIERFVIKAEWDTSAQTNKNASVLYLQRSDCVVVRDRFAELFAGSDVVSDQFTRIRAWRNNITAMNLASDSQWALRNKHGAKKKLKSSTTRSHWHATFGITHACFTRSQEVRSSSMHQSWLLRNVGNLQSKQRFLIENYLAMKRKTIPAKTTCPKKQIDVMGENVYIDLMQHPWGNNQSLM